jgi:hypothetical protein
MNWKDISVFQYQQIVDLLQKKVDEDTSYKLIGIVYKLTNAQVDSLSIGDYQNKVKEIQFIFTDIEGDPVNYINVNGRKYRFVYDVRKIPTARYIETKVFGEDLVNNLHKIFASMVMPMKKSLIGWKDDVYDAMKHEEYANDILEASIQDVYPSMLFFYHVYRNWMEVSQDYLIKQIEKKGVPQAKRVVQGLLKSMDGSIAPRLLPTTKIAKLQKFMNSQQSNS